MAGSTFFQLCNRPPLDDRLILEAVIYKICRGIPWYDLPPGFPSHQTVYRRYRRWQRLGLRIICLRCGMLSPPEDQNVKVACFFD